MFIEINVRDGVPIYRQIVSQVKYSIAAGRLRAHQELPAIRVLAEHLVITPNTVAKAYRELETEGLIYKRQGAGTYVAEIKPSIAKVERRRRLVERIDALLAEAKQFEFEADELFTLIEKRYRVIGYSSVTTKVQEERPHDG